ncbi:hypothetical protein [Mariniluteicoccus flavus]
MKLTPSAWDDGARDVEGVAEEFAREARALVRRTTDVSAIGSDQGNSTADDAVCLILPAAALVFEEAIKGLESGLRGESALMKDSAAMIRDTEDHNTTIAKNPGV